MARRHFYLGIENLNLDDSQRTILIAELRALGPASDPQPARLNHWRTRLDGQAAIFEANFNENALTIETFKKRLGAIFGVSWITIGASTQIAHFAGGDTPVITFSRTGTDYLRVALFGDIGVAWNESGDECRGYLKVNQAEWEWEGDA